MSGNNFAQLVIAFNAYEDAALAYARTHDTTLEDVTKALKLLSITNRDVVAAVQPAAPAAKVAEDKDDSDAAATTDSYDDNDAADDNAAAVTKTRDNVRGRWRTTYGPYTLYSNTDRYTWDCCAWKQRDHPIACRIAPASSDAEQ